MANCHTCLPQFYDPVTFHFKNTLMIQSRHNDGNISDSFKFERPVLVPAYFDSRILPLADCCLSLASQFFISLFLFQHSLNLHCWAFTVIACSININITLTLPLVKFFPNHYPQFLQSPWLWQTI